MNSTRPSWQEQALCRSADPDVFFPITGHQATDAKRVCAQCLVRTDCLDCALAIGETHGIWGGLSELERRELRQRG